MFELFWCFDSVMVGVVVGSSLVFVSLSICDRAVVFLLLLLLGVGCVCVLSAGTGSGVVRALSGKSCPPLYNSLFSEYVSPFVFLSFSLSLCFFSSMMVFVVLT